MVQKGSKMDQTVHYFLPNNKEQTTTTTNTLIDPLKQAPRPELAERRGSAAVCGIEHLRRRVERPFVRFPLQLPKGSFKEATSSL